MLTSTSWFLAVTSSWLAFACGGIATEPSDIPSHGTDSGAPSSVVAPQPAASATALDPKPVSPSVEPKSVCFSTLSWTHDGGRVAYDDVSSLEQCPVVYQHRRTSRTDFASSFSCEAPLPRPHTNSGLDAVDVLGQLGVQEVTRAFSSGVARYGSDPSACDGSVLLITYQGKTITIGNDDCTSECGGQPAPNCVPVPPPLRRFATMLENIDTQELARPECASLN